MAIQAQLYNEGVVLPEIDASFTDFWSNAPLKSQIPYSQYHHHLHLQHQQQQQARLQEIQTQAAFDHVEKKQRLEIDQYINFQNGMLRSILQNQRKQHVRNLVRYAEPRLAAILRGKDDEIARARKKATELEDLVTRLEAESHLWQRLARESEAKVAFLTDALHQTRERADSCQVGSDDAESCCGEAAEEGSGDALFCRNCVSNKASMLFLPCRHLCSCKQCEVVLDRCPVCTEPKKASIEALTF